MLSIDTDGDEDVQCRDLRHSYRYQTAVRVVYEQIASQRSSSIVVYATRAVCDITHYQRRSTGTESRQNVGYSRREQQQALWELQGYRLGA